MSPRKHLIVGISGLRGIVGETLTPGVIVAYAGAYAVLVKRWHKGKRGRPRIVVGTDSRPSREFCERAVASALSAGGCDAVLAGMIPTPTVQVAVEKTRAAGGIVITASHNPIEWNGLKFFAPGGGPVSAADWKRLIGLVASGRAACCDVARLGAIVEDRGAVKLHSKAVLAAVSRAVIRRRGFRVALDANRGAGAVIAPDFLRALGCKVFELDCTADGKFRHRPEPVPESLGGLCRLVKRARADVGFAQDPDADRLAIVSERGVPISEELSVVLAASARLRKKRGPVVVNLSTTRAVDIVAGRSGVPVFRTPVGEVNVVNGMRRKGAVIGGEGNGGVIDPRVGYCRDSITGMGLVLELMASSRMTVSALVDDIGPWTMVKKKLPWQREQMPELLARFRRGVRGARVDTRDGVHAAWPGGWVHVRPSNTEPLARIFAEAPGRRQAERLARAAEELCRGRRKRLDFTEEH